jgi:peptidoglycan/LPS O-acetylase OafA/YrhL
LAVLAFPLLIALLALTRGWLRSALSARWLQYGGHSSYSLYLVHMFFIYLFYWVIRDWPNGAGPVAENLLAAACLLAMALATHVLFKYVEEPARLRLRALVPKAGVARVGASVEGASVEGTEEGSGVRGQPVRALP